MILKKKKNCSVFCLFRLWISLFQAFLFKFAIKTCSSWSESWGSQWSVTKDKISKRKLHRNWPCCDRKPEEIRKSKTGHLCHKKCCKKYRIQKDKRKSNHCCEIRPLPGKYCTNQIAKSSKFWESLKTYQYGTFLRGFFIQTNRGNTKFRIETSLIPETKHILL